MEQQENRRIEFIDLTKGLCIMLVVMMHVGGAFDGLATGPVLSSFTMPLYFFVSGLFFKSYEGFGGFLARKVDKLLVPFLIFYLGAFLLMYGISKAVPGTFRLPVRWNELLLIFRNHELIRFNPPIWFLVALFNCNMLFYVVHYLRRKHIPTMFAVTLLIGATGFWLGKQRIELPFYIDVAMTALPFYFAGFWIRRYNFFSFRTTVSTNLSRYSSWWLWSRCISRPHRWVCGPTTIREISSRSTWRLSQVFLPSCCCVRR